MTNEVCFQVLGQSLYVSVCTPDCQGKICHWKIWNFLGYNDRLSDRGWVIGKLHFQQSVGTSHPFISSLQLEENEDIVKVYFKLNSLSFSIRNFHFRPNCSIKVIKVLAGCNVEIYFYLLPVSPSRNSDIQCVL